MDRTMEHKNMCTDCFAVPRQERKRCHRSQGVADGVGVSSVRLHYEPGAKPSRGLLGSTFPAGFHLGSTL